MTTLKDTLEIFENLEVYSANMSVGNIRNSKCYFTCCCTLLACVSTEMSGYIFLHLVNYDHHNCLHKRN